LTIRMIELDRQGKLDAGIVNTFNDLVLNQLAEHAYLNYRNVMSTWQNAYVSFLKVWWDTLVYFVTVLPLHYYNIYDNVQLLQEYNERFRPIRALNARMQPMFAYWAELATKESQSGLLEYSHLFGKWMMRLFARPSVENTFADWNDRVDFVEELAIALFEAALKETMPEKLSEFPDPFWVNAWGISL